LQKWSNDVKYFYYLHGPLARVELGDEKVQGIDYAYTLQGWLKGVNSNTLVPQRDIGNDALAENINAYSGRDVFGYSLDYFQGDYSGIGSLALENNFLADNSQSGFSLYNGNISGMATTIYQYNTETLDFLPKAILNHYRYDQLNRISSANPLFNDDVMFSQLISDSPLISMSIEPPPDKGTHATHTLGLKRYELTNHLGNVLTTVSDRKNTIATGAFTADIVSSQDYYLLVNEASGEVIPFGSLMPGRKYNSGRYRFGFNGMEKDDEVFNSTGTSYTTHFRQYDPRIGRWMSLDPKKEKYPDLSPYSGMGNNPIKIIDSNGDTLKIVGNPQFVTNTNIYIAKLRATDKGRVMLNVLENATTVYTIKEAASFMTSAYNGNQSFEFQLPGGLYMANTMYYDDTPWKSSLGGADIDGFLIFGHEFYHMYSDEMSLRVISGFFDGFVLGSQLETLAGNRAAEGGAMAFGNYLRTVYGYKNWKRSNQGNTNTDFTKEWKYKGKSFFNTENERITGFELKKGIMSTGSGLNSQNLGTKFTKSHTKGGNTTKVDEDGKKKE
jgi:RHS repeat-associated protein